MNRIGGLVKSGAAFLLKKRGYLKNARRSKARRSGGRWGGVLVWLLIGDGGWAGVIKKLPPQEHKKRGHDLKKGRALEE